MYVFVVCCFFFFFKQKTAYEMRISDWSSDVCSSDLAAEADDAIMVALLHEGHRRIHRGDGWIRDHLAIRSGLDPGGGKDGNQSINRPAAGKKGVREDRRRAQAELRKRGRQLIQRAGADAHRAR